LELPDVESAGTDPNPDCGALHLRFKKAVGNAAEIVDGGKNGDHRRLPASVWSDLELLI
jgi:hypothetical protein